MKNSKSKQELKIKEITPSAFQCIGVLACPSIFSTDEETFIIIGKTLSKKEAKKLLGNRVGKDETVVVVPKGLITEITEK
jgi:hypothetical protein